MFPFPTYVFPANGPHRFEEGALVALPAELTSRQHQTLYRAAPPGWHCCSLGYWYHAAIDSERNRYVTVGLTIEGERAPKRKLYFPPIKVTKAQIEHLSRRLISEKNAERISRDKARTEKEAELSLLVHDLRGLSSAIYNAGLEARTDLESGAYSECRTRIENVLATQTLLSIRIDGLDLAANPHLLTGVATIPVFRKVDKVVRCFRAKGNSKQLRIELHGQSFGTISGPNVFELIPFALVDNAIKYSPSNQQIDVLVEESASHIRVRVCSIGPQIEPDEREKIFEKGYRGLHATATGISGTGVGLAMVQKLVNEHFVGRIAVAQTTERFQMNMVRYFDTEFVIEFPREN